MVMVAALALAGGACGGDDDGDVTDDAAAATDESNGDADSSDTDSGDEDDTGGSESDQNSEGTIEDGGGDDTADTVADENDDSISEDGTLRDVTMAQLIGVGLTEDQAACIVDNIDDLEEFAQTGASDPTAFLNLVGTCEIDLTQLTPPAEPGG
jgi:hypothetical protein